MLVKTKAIVLHAFKYGESKLIADLLTAGCGRLSCVAAVGKSPKGKLKKQYFQPLSIVEVVIDQRRRTGLQPVKEARVAVPFATIPFDPLKLSLALFTAEFLRNATRGEQVDENTYAYAENSIRWLDGCGSRFANFHLVFMMRLAKFLGFYPNLGDYAEGCLFDLRAACFCNSAPAHSDWLSAGEAGKIIRLLRMNYATMHLYRMTRDERNRMVDVILKYYGIHVADFGEMKSLAVLKELF